MVAAVSYQPTPNTFGIPMPPDLDTSFDTVIIIDGLPIAPVAKFEKLVNLIRKTFLRFGEIVEDGLYLPIDDSTQQTVGYGFVEYRDEESAQAAIATMDKTPLDKKHTFRVFSWKDFDRLENYDDEYVPAERNEFLERDNLQSWLQDEQVRDQFALRFADETQIKWHDPLMNEGSTPCYSGEKQKLSGKNWTEMQVQWSPLGSYLATFHQQGVMLWGGSDWSNMARFGHESVKLIDFSPCERYLVTYSGIESTKRDECDAVQIFDTRSVKLLRGFAGLTSKTLNWPIFKWSHDGRYFARLGENEIHIYETSTMKLLDGKPLKADSVQEFEWSPSQHIICHWSPELDNIPATVSLVSVPDRKTLREKHLFNVYSVNLHWQSSGEYLCVRVARLKSKTKNKANKVVSTNLEVFRLMEKDVPVEVVEFKDPISCFAWEPRGARFAVVHGEGFANKYSVSFYVVKKSKIKLDYTLPETKPVNNLFWSPTGSFIILAGLGQMNGTLDFFDVNRKVSMAVNEHFMCNTVLWSSSGVYVTTAVTQPMNSREAWRFANESGCKIWTFQGVLKQESPTEQFYQFHWRPRPQTLLSKEQIHQIRGSIRETYYKKFDEEDESVRQSQLSVEARSRADAKKWFRDYRAQCEARVRADAAARQELRGGVPSEDEADFEVTDVSVEEEIEVQENILP